MTGESLFPSLSLKKEPAMNRKTRQAISRAIHSPEVVPMSRVIYDSRNASKDKFIPTLEAMRLYREGKLHWDAANEAYCYPK
jgi:hypothetical protein